MTTPSWRESGYAGPTATVEIPELEPTTVTPPEGPHVWVATQGTDHEGDVVIGVRHTADEAKQLAEDYAGHPLTWTPRTVMWDAPGRNRITFYEVQAYPLPEEGA